MDKKEIREIKDRLDLVNSNLAAILGFFREVEDSEEEEKEEENAEEE